jgi:NADPH:quinone reductase-like Zn-dependent oxidoreductase
VHAAVPFADAPEAHRILAARENVGKVVLVP